MGSIICCEQARSSSGPSGGAEDDDCRLISDFSEASNPTCSSKVSSSIHMPSISYLVALF